LSKNDSVKWQQLIRNSTRYALLHINYKNTDTFNLQDSRLLNLEIIHCSLGHVYDSFTDKLTYAKHYANNDYKQEHLYDKYQKTDSVGQSILDVTGANAKTQLGAWNHSLLKDEFLDLFPDFTEMKNFINDRVRGKILKDKLTKTVTTIEDKFFSGGITAEDAKRELSTLK